MRNEGAQCIGNEVTGTAALLSRGYVDLVEAGTMRRQGCHFHSPPALPPVLNINLSNDSDDKGGYLRIIRYHCTHLQLTLHFSDDMVLPSNVSASAC